MSPVSNVAIVGIGALSPDAGDAPTFRRNIRAGLDGITAIPPARRATMFSCQTGRGDATSAGHPHTRWPR
jgi:acyl transferase domain-containing protein